MTTLPLSVLVDPLKIEELFQNLDNRKKLEQMLLDPRVIEMSRQSPKSREALAAVVRRLQEERARKRRIRNAEQKEELPPAKWFNCINFLKNFSAPPRQNTRNALRNSEPTLRARHKVSRSTPNLESTALPSIVNEESPTFFMNPQPTAMAEEMTVCIPNMSKDSSFPLNLMEFCSSEQGKTMITSLIKSTDFKQFFGVKSILPTQYHQSLQCIDCFNCSDQRYIQYYSPRKSSCQRFIILRSRASSLSVSSSYLTFDGYRTGLKSVVSSATQTAYSGSCSQCSSNCLSTETFNSYNDDTVNEEIFKKKPFELALCQRNNIVKGTKSQSAMYTTDYSECDCEDFSSPDEICGGRYLSRILTHAVVPNIDYLTTPDVLVTYSGNGHSSDSGSSSSSCKVCKGNISSESFQREPREIWTQKRLKTSCESCLNTFRTEYIRKSRYSKDITKSSNVSGSFGSLSSEESSQIANNIREIGEKFYVQAKSILQNVGELGKREEFDRRKDLEMIDYSEHGDGILQEGKCEIVMNNNNYSNSIGNDVPTIEFEGGQTDSNGKHTDSVYESPAPSLHPMVEKSLSYSSIEKEQNATINEHPKTQLDGSLPQPKEDSADLQLEVSDRKRLLDKSIFSSSSSVDETAYTENLLDRVKKQRKRVRNKYGSASNVSDSSSTSSLPQFRTFPRRLKPKPVPNQKPTTPPQSILQKVNKSKSRKKNCAIM